MMYAPVPMKGEHVHEGWRVPASPAHFFLLTLCSNCGRDAISLTGTFHTHSSPRASPYRFGWTRRKESRSVCTWVAEDPIRKLLALITRMKKNFLLFFHPMGGPMYARIAQSPSLYERKRRDRGRRERE